jgi:hypothetical protein
MVWSLAFLPDLKRFSNKCSNSMILLDIRAEDNGTNCFMWFSPFIVIYFALAAAARPGTDIGNAGLATRSVINND